MPAKEIDLSEFKKIRKPGCGFAQLDLLPEHAEKLRVVMQSTDYSSKGIHEVMKGKWKYAISEESVRKHRAGTCGCP